MGAGTVSDILILLLGHKDRTLGSLYVFRFHSFIIKLQEIFTIQLKIVVESSANQLRIRKTTESDCRLQNGLLLILFKPLKQTAEQFFIMDLKRYLRNPCHFKLHSLPNKHHYTSYASGRIQQHFIYTCSPTRYTVWS